MKGRKIVRELFSANGYLSQAPAQVQFGLGQDTKIDKLTIRWPSGRVQELTGVAADRHVVIDEGEGRRRCNRDGDAGTDNPAVTARSGATNVTRNRAHDGGGGGSPRK